MSRVAGTKLISDMGFSSEWLDLREPADHAARDKGLLSAAIGFAGPDAIVVDLGSGTGSTARAFRHDACTNWRWRFVDGDTDLLAVASSRHSNSEIHVMDLKNVDDLPLKDASLVTASALLDLMPNEWVCKLAKRLSATATPFYAALNYNGYMNWSPELQTDEEIKLSFNRHQKTDKGIGLATGPDSARVLEQLFGEYGFDVTLRDSPWVLGQDQAALQTQLNKGVADAADEIGNSAAREWLSERAGRQYDARLVVGHTDVLAIPRPYGRD